MDHGIRGERPRRRGLGDREIVRQIALGFFFASFGAGGEDTGPALTGFAGGLRTVTSKQKASALAWIRAKARLA